jgi:two-component system alkaline phosphatase synthesis response regulator PhoP
MTRWCLVVEDESPLGEMICDNLAADGFGTELVKDGRSATDRIEKGGLDLILLDIMLPKQDGFAVLRQMRARGDRTPVLILSARSADDDRIRGLELEADDYLTKPFNLRELLLRVRALMRRAPATVDGEEPLVIGGVSVDFRAHMARKPDGDEQPLSDSELRLLRLLGSRSGQVVSRREILDHVFGATALPAARTLDNLVLQVRRLFEPDGRHPRYLHTVRGVGYRLTPEAET